MRATLPAFTIALLAVTAAVDAQSAKTPREVRPDRAATSTLSGTVVSDDEEARPLRHARVMCSAAELASGLTTVTDDNGRFRFERLPAGRFTVRAVRPGWIETVYGARPSRRSGVPIALADGQSLAIVIRMPRGAVITGTVLDLGGQPAVGAGVAAMRYAIVGGERRLMSFGVPSVTDDRGVYRIYGLPPGDFVVAAAGSPARAGGPATSVRLTTDLDVHHARTAAPQMPPPPDRHVTFALTYFPGTTYAAQAARVSLRAGDERTGIDFALQLVPVAAVDGYVSNRDGPSPAGVQVTLLASGGDIGEFPLESLRTTTTAADGSFSLAGVSPGQYTLLARANAPVQWASAQIAVEGDRVSGVSLSLAPALTITGAVRFEGERLRPPSPTSIRVGLRPLQSRGSVGISPPEVTAGADGRFTIAGVTPGVYRLTASFPGSANPEGWSLRSALIGRQDTLDLPVTIAAGLAPPEASIVFADRSSSLAGTITLAADHAATDYTIVLFPAEAGLRVPESRRTRAVRPSSDGTFSISHLPAGDYLVTVLDDVDEGEWVDPAFLERIAPGAIRIAIADGEQKFQALRIARN